MKWKKYTIYTTTEAEDLISMMLNENGVEGVQIENKVPLSESDTRGMFIDILPDLGPDDGISMVSFFLHLYDPADEEAKKQMDQEQEGADKSYAIADKLWTEEEIAALMETVEEEIEAMRAYCEVGEGRIEVGATEDTDWRDNWKQYFKPIKTGGFVIKPSWVDLDDEMLQTEDGKPVKVIEIDPGTAFGTGAHETTQLCMQALEEYAKEGDKALDIGTGSGILGIAALRCGASFLMATEIDGNCESSIRDNVGFNHVTDEEFHLVIGNILADEDVIREVHEGEPEGYDIVIANILAPVIVMLAAEGAADQFCKKGGIFITSGIIDTKLPDVQEAFAANPNWEVLKVNVQGEWTSVVARRV